MTVAQIFAWTISLITAIGFVASQYQYGLRWGAWWSDVANRTIHLSNSNLNWSFFVLIPTIGALALVAGVVVYLASEKS